MTASHPRKSDRRTRCLSTGHGRARPDIRLSSQIVRQLTEFDATRRSSSSRFTIHRLAGAPRTPFTHLIRGNQIPIAQAPPPTSPSPRFPCMGLFLSRSSQSGKSVVFHKFLCSISKPVSSSRPAVRLRRRAQKLSRLAVAQDLAIGSAVARPHLDSFEHDGTLGAIGMTIRGEPASGAEDLSRHNLVFGGSKDPNHDAVIRIGSEAPKRRTHSPFRH